MFKNTIIVSVLALSAFAHPAHSRELEPGDDHGGGRRGSEHEQTHFDNRKFEDSPFHRSSSSPAIATPIATSTPAQQLGNPSFLTRDDSLSRVTVRRPLFTDDVSPEALQYASQEKLTALISRDGMPRAACLLTFRGFEYEHGVLQAKYEARMSDPSSSIDTPTSPLCDSDLYDDRVDNRLPLLRGDDTIHVYGEHGDLVEYRHD